MGMRGRHADFEDRQPGLFDQEKKIALTPTQIPQLAKLIEALLAEIAAALATGEASNEQDNH